MKKQETILLDEKWMNPIKISGKHLTCKICRKVPVGANNQVECEGCRTLFCRHHFDEIQILIQNCPGCEEMGVSQAKNIHTAVRQAFQRVMLSCEICEKAEDKGKKILYSNKQLAKHLESHDLKKEGLKDKQEFELRQYVLTSKSGVIYPLGLSEQILINFCMSRREKICCFLGSDQRPLVIDTHNKIGYFDQQGDHMSLTSEPNKQIESLKTYTLFYFRRDKDYIFFDTDSQDEILTANRYLGMNRRCHEFHIEKEDILLRINLKEKTIYDTTTKAIYRLEYKEFSFK